MTLTQLRRARRRWQHLVAQSRRTGVPIDESDLERRLLLEEDDSTLVVGALDLSEHRMANGRRRRPRPSGLCARPPERPDRPCCCSLTRRRDVKDRDDLLGGRPGGHG